VARPCGGRFQFVFVVLPFALALPHGWEPTVTVDDGSRRWWNLLRMPVYCAISGVTRRMRENAAHFPPRERLTISCACSTNGGEMVGAFKAFGIKFVDVLRARGLEQSIRILPS
jgi:hypothetical protein